MPEELRILLVEDNPDDIFFVTRILKRQGLGDGLTVLTDGRQALDYLGGTGPYADRTLHPLPHLVLLDLQLPYYTGLQILDWAQSQDCLTEVAIVVLSSSTQQSDIDQALKSGARSYHVKPTNPNELTGLVQSLRAQFFRGERQPA